MDLTTIKNWMLDSGIQNTGGAHKGSFNAWIDLAQDNCPYVYSEITGYGISTLVLLGRVTKDTRCLDRAHEAANWLLSQAMHPCGGVRTRQYYAPADELPRYSFQGENIYAFDNGMVLYGLVQLYAVSGNKRYLKAACSIADFLLRKLRRPDGLFFAYYNARTKERGDSPEKWSSQTGSYHAKLALGLIEISEATGNDVYRSAARLLCRQCLKFQDPSGRFITSRLDSSTHLHPHAYSAEGLLYAGICFNEDIFLASAERALQWAMAAQADDGGIPKMFDGKAWSPYYRSDILAQILRLGVLLHQAGRAQSVSRQQLQRLKDCLLRFQNTDGTAQGGGFFYGTTLQGKRLAHVNSWCTMFAIQALQWWQASENKIQTGRARPQLFI